MKNNKSYEYAIKIINEIKDRARFWSKNDELPVDFYPEKYGTIGGVLNVGYDFEEKLNSAGLLPCDVIEGGLNDFTYYKNIKLRKGFGNKSVIIYPVYLNSCSNVVTTIICNNTIGAAIWDILKNN